MQRLSKQEIERRMRKYFNAGPNQDAVFIPALIGEYVAAVVEAMRNNQDSVTLPIELAAALSCFLEHNVMPAPWREE